MVHSTLPAIKTLSKFLAITLVIPTLGLAGCDADDEFDDPDAELDAELDEDPMWRPDRTVVTEVYSLDDDAIEDEESSEPPTPIPPLGIDGAPIGPEQRPALNQGTATTAFSPVVHIQTADNGLCTATAISDEVLVTATHCLKQGDDVTSWIKVRKAHGANSGSEGESSSYFMMSEDIYDNYYVEESNGSDYYSRDIAFVKFAPGTFSAWYPLGSTAQTSDLNGDDVILIGFGGTDTKHYGPEVVTSVTAYGSLYMYAKTDNTNNVANTEKGDSGGPMLRAVGNSYEVVGVLYGSNNSSSFHPVITDHVYNHITPILNDSLPTYCADAWKDSNYSGLGFSFCVTSTIIDDFEDDSSFTDTYTIAWHHRYSKWNNELSSVVVPDDMIVTLYRENNLGGYSTTFQDILPMGDASASANLSNESMHDSTSSIWLTYTNSPLSLSYQIESKEHNKCFDLTNNSTANGTVIEQRSCDETDSGQQFSFHARGNGYEIRHDASGKCIQSWLVQFPLQLYTCDGGSDQLFTFDNNGTTSAANDFHIETYDGWCVAMLYDSDNGRPFMPMPCNEANSAEDHVIRFR